MRAEDGEDVVRPVATGCAVVLLFGPLGGRTTWEAVRGTSSATDAGGYNAVAVFSGVVALAALGFALWARPRPVLPLLGAAVAVAAFGLTAYAAGVFVVARLRGGVWVYACWCFEGLRDGWTVAPAPGPPFFALAALVGAIASLALAASWLRQPNGDAAPRVPFG
ncbi:MAG: hypothetical protein IT337_01215 [Thermomicrobiales bacterium]|nr:hypothetical protein [Thermomicrobiales bacterium]